ncbi:MAG TPA: molecular chaperone HtpG, partial [Spirochaetes bacterium]|nr:molecular chaperone HtpG [Spirochaetota bacterium]
KKTITIADTGLGMNEQDLVDNLGTIARSGTRDFIESLTGDRKNDSSLIGQFGVGFYSSFMVSEKVEVISKKAGEEKAWLWTSDGKGSYEIKESERDGHGTTVILHLNEDGAEFANRWSIENVIKKYSNHIQFPIYLRYEDTVYEGEGDKKKPRKEMKENKINDGTALWKKPKGELKPEDYNEFYKVISHDSSDPLLHIHTQAEGALEYTTLFYVPSKAPVDLYFSDYRPGVKLYIKRVFITDNDRELMPSYLRFVRGIIDSEDLPLNVSRETLQHNRVLAKIRSTSVKKILSELTVYAGDREKYDTFYGEFGRQIKEGLYQDFENRDTLLELVRFKSTRVEGYTSLDEYKERMKPDQKSIYYITGEREETLRESPLLELYREKDIEVLLMTDEMDEIVVPSIGRYKDLELKSVNRTDAAEDLKSKEDLDKEKELGPVIEKIKEVLKDRVKDVKASTRLSDSPSCIVADEKDPTVQMQSILKSMGHTDFSGVKPVLEINPNHEIVKRLNGTEDSTLIEDASFLLLEQAMLIEGMKLANPGQFVKRLNRFLEKGL